MNEYTWDEACGEWIKCHMSCRFIAWRYLSVFWENGWKDTELASFFMLVGMLRGFFLLYTFALTGLWNKTISTWWYFTDCFEPVCQDEWYYLIGYCALLGLDIKIEIFLSQVFVCRESQGSAPELMNRYDLKNWHHLDAFNALPRLWFLNGILMPYVIWHAKMTFN